MFEDDDPNLITSGKSSRIVVGGYPFVIDIVRLETNPKWTLEVVDYKGTSYVWEDQFHSDGEARETAINTIETDGPVGFMNRNNIIPFRRCQD